MPQSVNTNVASLNAQRNLNRTQGTLSTALERLSTGLRINSARDDAAGLAITERFSTQIRGLNQAVRNANDGISLAQTAEAAIGELSNNLQRIRELAVQSANATNSASDRAALDAEVQQRIAEVDRIAAQTSFNGLKVLDGTFGTAQFQVGANVGETIAVNLNVGVRAGQVGQIATATGTATANALANLTIAVGAGEAVAVGATAGPTQDSAEDKVTVIKDAGISGLTATATTAVTDTFAAVVATAGGADDSTYSLTINGTDIYASFAIADGTSVSGGDVANQVNLFSSQTGVTASFDGTNITLDSAEGKNIVATQTIAGDTTGAGVGAVTIIGQTARGDVTLTAAENITLTGDFVELGLTNTIAKDASTISNVSITTVANANDAISRVDSALTTVSSLRSDLGAIQNRFDSTITNLASVSENLSAARGRILDADFAAETAALTKAQILQQAGIAVLSQANAQPQLVLSLLQ